MPFDVTTSDIYVNSESDPLHKTMVKIIEIASFFAVATLLLSEFPGVQSQGLQPNIRMCQGQPLCPPPELEKPEPKTECDPQCKKINPFHSAIEL
jgi:hypothetical protein